MASKQWIPVVLAVIVLVALAGCSSFLPPGWDNATSEQPVEDAMQETQEDLTVLDEAEEAEEAIEETPVEEEVPDEATATSADEGLPRKNVVEGDLVSFPNLQAVDPDGDTIAYTFTPPLDSAGKWQTKVGDAGEYRVTITASDGKNSVSQVVIISVAPKNKPPVIQLAAKEITVKEGEQVTLNIQASDPDGDKVTLSFDGWMTSASRGTDYDDAGSHEVTITASDGTVTAQETVRVIVENVNRAPAISPISDIIIKEGDKITVNPTASDPDGDRVTFLYGSPVSADGTWQSSKQDVGKYRVNVTATDGSLSAETSFLLVVESLNNPPVIQIADLITVDEGQAVTLQPAITDPEGDELTISYGGWMSGPTYTATYEDSGSHLVTITVSDGINTVKKDLTVMVSDVNRPPTFGSGAFN
jgi:hypothetical protein